MKLEHHGKSISVAVDKITKEGVWLSIDSHSYLLDFIRYPWFENAQASKVFQAEPIGREGICWDELDIDLSLDSILNPDRYPLKARV